MGNFENLNKAVADLEAYYEVQSLSDYYLRAVSGEGSAPTSTDVQPEMEVFNDILSVQDGGRYIGEILTRALAAEPTGLGPDLGDVFRVLHHSNAGGLSPISNASGTGLEKMAGHNDEAASPSKANPSAAMIQVLPSKLNFSVRDTGAIQIFMNAIPTLEWSRCVPYFDLQVITKTAPVTTDGKVGSGISLVRFLNGKSVVSVGSADFNLQAGAIPGQPLPPSTEDGLGDSPQGPTIAGMEIFTSPQTLTPMKESYRDISEIMETIKANNANPDEAGFPGSLGSPRGAAILDRTRPFMTVENFNIKVVPTRGMMSHKSAEMDIVLHDRSRLSEVSYLTKPDQFGHVELLVEYGWSHPDAKSGRNPYGLFLNSLRCKEKYGVTNAKYKFTDDGQVSISLSLVTRGVDQVNIANVGAGLGTDDARFKTVEKIIELVNTSAAAAGDNGSDYSDIAGFSSIANLSPTNVGELINDEEVNGFISQYANGEFPALSEIASKLEALKGVMATANTLLSKLIDIHAAKSEQSPDPFFFYNGKVCVPKNLGSPGSFYSFGSLFYNFVVDPLLATRQFNEIHAIFYCFNDKASYMHSQNLASMPIKRDQFKKLYKKHAEENVQVSVGSFLSFMNQFFLSNMAATAYGFSSLYSRDEDGSAKRLQTTSAAAAGSQKDKILVNAYGGGEPRFKLPRIRVIPECVPHVDPDSTEASAPNKTGTILRLHVVDDQADKYASISDLIKASSSSGINAVRDKVDEFQGSENPANHGEMKSEIVKAANEYGLLAAEGDYSKVVGGPSALKHFIKKNMPYIEVGGMNGAVQDFGLSSMHNSADATIHMIRAMKEAGSDNPGVQDRGLPMRISPIQGQMKCLGCPILNHGQRFFIDLRTGTTADNVYVVSGLDHKISPGKFETTAKLIQVDSMGQYESLLNVVDKAIATINKLDEG